MTNKPSKPLEDYPKAEVSSLPKPPPVGPQSDPSQQAKVIKPVEVATLDFINPSAFTKTVKLKHPFKLDGVVIERVTITRLSLGQVGIIADRMKTEEGADPIEFYAAMAGLPVPVLRGMKEVDGMAVMEAATPFLPRFADLLLSLQIGETGGDLVSLLPVQ